MGKHTDTREAPNRPGVRHRRTTGPHPVLVSAAADQTVRWKSGERLDQLFEERCDRLREAGRQDHLAVDAGAVRLTYDQLDGRANQLARYLLSRGLRPGDRVALLFDQAVFSYVAMLAVLKIRAAYVPLDVGFPADRLSYIVNDAGAAAVLTLADLRGTIPDVLAPLLCLDEEEERIAAQPPSRLGEAERGQSTDELCYIIYTSGSTGRPKGVAIEHASICNFVRVASDVYGVRSDDRVYQGMTIAFDFSVEEIWVSWMAGATLVPKPRGVSLLGPDLGDFLVANSITALCCVPTLLATLEDDVDGLRFLLVSGEACPQDLMLRWHRPGRRFLNVYGPTEATVTATWAVVDPSRTPTLGVPLPSYSALILDPETAAPVRPGEMGEICLAGVGLARGYVNREDLTEKAFIPDFLGIPNNPPGRIYRTGDLGRINGDGEIEYHGRIDTQVKVRGYRIELAEIESVLLQVPGIAQAAVGTHEAEPGMTELVAYYTRRRNARPIDVQSMHETLRSLLPAYMVPAYFVELEALPMLPSDKVDRKRLPSPEGRRISLSREVVPPATDAERTLAAALAKVLGSEYVSVTAHVFNDLGANSMIMAKFCAEVRRHGGFGLSMKDTYLHPTIRDLAASLGETAAPPAAAASNVLEPKPHRRATRGEYVLCGTLQFLTFVAGAFLSGFVLLVGFRYSTRGTDLVDTFIRSFQFSLLTFIGLSVLPLLMKWILIGRWKEQEIVLWTPAYFRFWLVRTLMRANPMRLFAGSPLYVLYLRLLGAKIGPRTAILSTAVPVCPDLLTVGADVVLRKTTAFNCYRVIDGVIQTGRVSIGDGAFVGEGSVLDVGSSLGSGSQLAHASALYAGQSVPSGESWHGSPAQRCNVDYAGVEPRECSTRRRVVYSIFTFLNRIALLAPLGIGTLSALLGPYLSSGTLNHGTWRIYTDLLLFSFVVVFGGILGALVLVTTVPRLLNLLIKPGEIYPLYGIRYAAHRTISRLTNLTLLLQLTGDSSLIMHYVRLLGYKLPSAVQTGSNFGVALRHESPYLSTVGSGTMVADGLSMMNACYSSSSFMLSPVVIGKDNYLGNDLVFPVGAKVGDNCLLATKTMVPTDGPMREGVGLLGSPSFEIPRSVQRDAAFDEFKTGDKFRKSLAAKNRHNAGTIILFLLVRWIYMFVAMLLTSYAIELQNADDVLVATGTVLGLFVFTMVYFTLIERASLGFKRLKPTFCSIYERPFWRHERFWKLTLTGYLATFNGTPFKGYFLRWVGMRVGKRLFDDGCSVPERSIVTIGDDCCLNMTSVIQCHSMEDGAFKMEGITIGSNCTLGVKAFVHYGVTMGDGARLEPDSFLMKGEEVPAGGRYGGNPARELSAPVALSVGPGLVLAAAVGGQAPLASSTAEEADPIRKAGMGRHAFSPAVPRPVRRGRAASPAHRR